MRREVRVLLSGVSFFCRPVCSFMSAMPEATNVVNILVQKSPEDVTLKVSQPEGAFIRIARDSDFQRQICSYFCIAFISKSRLLFD